MSATDDYRAQLKAKIDQMQREQDHKDLLHDRSQQADGLQQPSEKFIEDRIGKHEPVSEQDIKRAAWTELEQERRPTMDERVAQDDTESFKVDDQADEVHRREDEKKKEIERDRDLADTKNRQAEVEQERKRLGREEIEQQQSHEQRQAIIKADATKEVNVKGTPSNGELFVAVI